MNNLLEKTKDSMLAELDLDPAPAPAPAPALAAPLDFIKKKKKKKKKKIAALDMNAISKVFEVPKY